MPAIKKSLLLALGAWVVLPAVPAQAMLSDTIHPYLAVARSHDSNLFRLDERAVIAQRGDDLTRTQLGVLVDLPLGRQRLTGHIKRSKVSFSRYTQLDYDGKDYAADLEWHIGNHLEGHVGATYAQTLTSFNDFHTAERNLRVQRRDYVDGAWRFHPSYRVRVAASRNQSTYDLPLQRYNNRTEDQLDAGFDYLPPSGSRFGVQASRIDGRYPNHRSMGGMLIDDSYTQHELKANVSWLFSATSQFQMLAGWAERKHSLFTERDTSGLNGRATMHWSMLRKLKMSASAWREFAAVESNLINNSINKGVSLNATWELTSKVAATAMVRREKRDFSTLEGRLAAPNLFDKTRIATVGLSWAPTLSSQLSVHAFHEVRSGNASTNYRANGAAVSASIQF
ncbi:MAG: outer membrane beta-barrel protein, partial [Burkholderiaceae bacterium]|nr:outer membrane beta-barrel protein [Burkholderiaceae bacterium]